MDPLRRVFAAVGFAPEVRMAVTERLRPLDLPGTVVTPENLHLTIRWYGDLDTVTFERLTAALDGDDLTGPFTVRLTELGAFPNARRATVLWIRPEAEELVPLHEAVEAAGEEAGIDREDRPFRPHLTVSRLRPDSDLRALVAGAGSIGITSPVTELVLLRSLLDGGRPRYEPLERFPLAGV